MTRVNYILLALLAVSFCNCAYANEMDGEWVSISRISAGKQQITTPTHAVIKAGKFNTVRDGKLSELGKITETTTKTPKQYNVNMTGKVKFSGKSFHGIFAISGDTMLTCVNPKPSGDRPAMFSSTKENGNIMIVWMRKDTLARLQKLSRNAGDAGEETTDTKSK